MTDDKTDLPRRRQQSNAALAARDAAALVRDLNRNLGLWQASSVKLHTMAVRLKAVGRSDPGVAEEARTLFQVVSAEGQRFESLLPAQTEAVSEHGRIKDTRRSFAMVTDRLRISLELLGVEPEAE